MGSSIKYLMFPVLQYLLHHHFLEENYITTSADWFMRPEGEKKVKPQRDCYSWIDKTVERRK